MASPAKAVTRKATGLNPQGYGRRAAESHRTHSNVLCGSGTGFFDFEYISGGNYAREVSG